MFIATLANWDDENRKAGNAYIRVMSTNTNQWEDPITVAVGQSPRKAVEAAGWTITSVARKIQGQVSFTIERKRPGLAGANAMVSNMVIKAGL